MNTAWENGIQSEIAFWKHWIETEGAGWPDDYAFRIDPNSQFQYGQFLSQFRGKTDIRILDVGSGPFTFLGKKWSDQQLGLVYTLNIVCCDALSDHYDKLPVPPDLPVMRPIKCDTEKLRDVFQAQSFDLVHARNTLDHSYDPVRCVIQMTDVCSPGGVVILDHFAFEATAAGGEGLHQWDFFIDKGDMLMQNYSSKDTYSLSGVLKNRITILDIHGGNSSEFFVAFEKIM